MTEPLDPESEQIREVYAHYGLAMYLAQCLEQAIYVALLFFDHFPKAVKSYTTAEEWTREADRFEEKELGQTMGKLIRRLSEAGVPVVGLDSELQEVLRRRNWLAHGYFSDRSVQLTVVDGREKMVAELKVLQLLFRSCSEQIDAVSMPVARKYGFTEEALEQAKLDLIAEHNRRREDA